MKFHASLLAGVLACALPAAWAAGDPPSCNPVRMADPGWTDITATNLEGGDAYFGPDYGSATVNTLSRRGFAQQCPNLGRLFAQMEFEVGVENAMITEMQINKTEARKAAVQQLKQRPKLVEAWLAGVKTTGGEDGLAAVKKVLGAE